MKRLYFLIALLLIFSLGLSASEIVLHREISWQEPLKAKQANGTQLKRLRFNGASIDNQTSLPVFYERVALKNNTQQISVRLDKAIYQIISSSDLEGIKNLDAISSEIVFSTQVSISRKSYYGTVSFVPIRKNQLTGQYERLISFDLMIDSSIAVGVSKKKNKTYTTNSVLASGNWYKVGVQKNGVYKLTYADFQTLGINVSSISSANIRIYGNGGGMLPHLNSTFRYDDLEENAIIVEDGGDGKFDSGDYLLFYGESPNTWSYSSSDSRYHHNHNLYTDYTYYFITTDLGVGKRIQDQSSVSGANTTVTTFDNYGYHELEDTNRLSSGRQWLGETFDITTEYTISDFSFSNMETSSPVYMLVTVAAESYSASYFSISAGSYTGSVSVSAISTNEDSDRVKEGSVATTFTSTSTTIPVSLSYSKTTSGSVGWLNYIEMNVRQKLTLSGSQLAFRDMQSVDAGKISEFNISGAGSNTLVWEVSDPTAVKKQAITLSGSTLSFTLATDTLREFIAFESSMAYTPSLVGSVANQNLHALGTDGNGNITDVDMIIISPTDFLTEAERLAEFHEQEDGLNVEVVNTREIYNEFSCGALDICAIRDFLKMFYDRADNASKIPSYVLLFGDGSFDPKGRKANNNNFVPVFESANSFNPVSSIVVDDFFVLLDDTEGEVDNTYGALDMSVGRFPVTNISQATTAVDKVIRYYDAASMGDWRNKICFVADDGEGNGFLSDAEGITSYISDNMKQFNIEKIYLDAYEQTSNAGGERYPDVNRAINDRVNKGALIVNYIGHGGELGWAHERVIEIADIISWNNMDNMPVFMTATCEFSRFDDPAIVSAGEDVFLNANGGGICLFTTTRSVYSSANEALNREFYEALFALSTQSSFTIGELYKNTKNGYLTSNSKSFTLLGDPALKIAFPSYGASTLTINNNDVTVVIDTLKALSKVTITGFVEDENGSKASSYSGILYPTVYDKVSTVSTLANDEESSITSFDIQNNILFKGKASITDGNFSFSFVVPKDIGYQYGNGKISYYLEDGEVDGSGYFENFIIGGTASNIGTDTKGPDVSLYLNDENFAFGGLTNEDPLLLSFVFDSNGVNTVGNGIGHDIAATLDDNSKEEIVLNEYYEADLNSYQSGSVRYQLSDLKPGRHTLNLKVWDVYNNVTEAYTEFIVEASAQLALEHVLNYPNPFTTSTQFWFEHNQPDIPIQVQIQIFTVSGKLVKSIHTYVETSGYRAEPIEWDGKDDFGDAIGKGVYVYRLSANSVNGSAEKFEKLVILK